MGVYLFNYEKIRKLNSNGETYFNCSLKNFNTFKIDSKAKIFTIINTLESFIKVMEYIETKKLKYFILGGGSNVLVSDKGYNGVILKFGGDLARIEYEDELLICGAGAKLASVYNVCRDLGLSGLENSAGIPANIGGATYMNAQAYEFEMSKIIEYVIAYHKGKIRYFSVDMCEFGYRQSIFQSGEYVILRVALKLHKSAKHEIEKSWRETLEKRKLSQPIEYPSAGSIFKRKDGYIISKMLDDMGIKGFRIGGAEVSKKHANFVINTGGARASDIYLIINHIKRKFIETYGFEPICEIKFLGEFDEINR